MGYITALLIDTVSIQRYVFSSNHLKENFGASYLVNNIYKEYLKKALNQTFNSKPNIDIWEAWEKNPDKVLLEENPDIPYEIGYIGGGNALILFRQADDYAKKFIRNWSKELLLKTPGLNTAVALHEVELKTFLNNFKESMKMLREKLKQNKNKNFPNTTLPKHGITADCPLSGYSAEIYYEDTDIEESKYISSVSMAKLNAVKDSKKLIEKEYDNVLGNEYTFANEIDRLGQREGKDHIAVVHIDGNSVGRKFKNCSDLIELRKLSIAVEQNTKNSYGKLFEYIKSKMGYFLNKDSGFHISKDSKGKTILPIRPIILGGDDITFITDGRLGVHFAEKFLNFFGESPVNGAGRLSACAGVAITRTKYPFFRAYNLADELCRQAKKEAKKEGNEGTSWLDFHIVYGGFSGDLEHIRSRHFQVEHGSLCFGPYLLSDEEDNEKSIKFLKEGVETFVDWPRSKVKELRSVLPLGKEAVTQFIEEIKVRGLRLPKMREGSGYDQTGWENKKTPYLDMIELMEFYPKEFLNRQKGGE
jgi:hypothetical protein